MVHPPLLLSLPDLVSASWMCHTSKQALQICIILFSLILSECGHVPHPQSSTAQPGGQRAVSQSVPNPLDRRRDMGLRWECGSGCYFLTDPPPPSIALYLILCTPSPPPHPLPLNPETLCFLFCFSQIMRPLALPSFLLSPPFGVRWSVGGVLQTSHLMLTAAQNFVFLEGGSARAAAAAAPSSPEPSKASNSL
eukprot:2013189-Pyramimonas_sp.AAC.1